MRFFFISLLALLLISYKNAPAEETSRVIQLRIDEVGMISDGLDTISTDELSEYIRERLFKSYMGTGKMYDKIKVEKINNGPVNAVWEVLVREIALGQKKALAEVCLHKYKKSFDTLKAKQQVKIRRQFPVLFQSDYS